MMPERDLKRGARIRTYLQLMRFPALFTALADIFLGFLLTRHELVPVGELALLLIASSGLYLAGMVFNDYFDREIDARERPRRPIPSGRISPRAAATLASGLIVLGPLCAGFVNGSALAISLMIAALILAYDGYLKQTLCGPVAMGGCRFLNVMLGASTAAEATWESPQVAVALAMGVYVAGVTWFARQEAERSAKAQLIAAAITIHAGVAGLAAVVWGVATVAPDQNWISWAALALVTLSLDVRILAAVRDPTPSHVQAAVKRMLLSIVLFDATMVFYGTGSPLLAAYVLALIVPAATLGRWIFIT
jgi:4-hydroxybenzoate polyprenyltransferase